MLEDAFLVWKARCGSQEAMARIYEKYANLLVTVARNLLADGHLAEDVVHDAFVSFAQRLDAFRLTGSLRSSSPSAW